MDVIKAKEFYNSDKELPFVEWLKYLNWQISLDKAYESMKKYNSGNNGFTYIESLR